MGSFKHPFGLFGLGRNEMPMWERHCQHSTFFSFLGRGLCMAHGSALACPNPLLQCSCSPQIFSGIWRRVEPRNWFSENRTMASQWSRMGPGSKLTEQTVDTCCCLCNRWKCNESWPAYPARNHQHSYHSCMKLERSTEIYWQMVTYITYITYITLNLTLYYTYRYTCVYRITFILYRCSQRAPPRRAWWAGSAVELRP